METYQLSFAKLIKHSESIYEIVVDEGVDFNEEHALEYNDLILNLISGPYGLIVNTINHFSLTGAGVLKAGNFSLEKKIAIVVYRKVTRMLMKFPIEFHKITNPDKEIKIFDNLDSAIEWLQETL